MNIVYLSLGSNEGDRERWLALAIAAIEKHCGNIAKRSSIYETAAWGVEDQPCFLNIVLLLYTDLETSGVLSATQAIEMELGRQRTVKWGQRTLDIDILLFNDDIVQDEQLTIPHPYLHLRRFTLEPLSEIAPELIHPVFKTPIATLLLNCADPLETKKLENTTSA